jgi:flagellar brake protein
MGLPALYGLMSFRDHPRLPRLNFVDQTMGTASAIKEQEDPCILTSRGEIERIVKELIKAKTSVTVGMTGGKKMSSMILDMDPKSGRFVYEAGMDELVKAIISSSKVFFEASLRGVTVKFSVGSSSTTTFENGPALIAPLPADMEYRQRREHFRTNFPKPYTATVNLANGKPGVLDLRDISVGGVGLSSMAISHEMLVPSSIVDASLDFGTLGKVDLSLKVNSHRKHESMGRVTHLFGCSFYNLSRARETILQRLVFQLDQLNRANSMTA